MLCKRVSLRNIRRCVHFFVLVRQFDIGAGSRLNLESNSELSCSPFIVRKVIFKLPYDPGNNSLWRQTLLPRYEGHFVNIL